MRFSQLARGLLGCTALPVLARPSSSIGVPNLLSRKRSDATKAGYLAVYWKTSENGIFFALSTNSDPLNFKEIKGGQPVIVPKLGTKVARDISIVPAGGADAGSKWYILGTDLNISATTWTDSEKFGSRGILTWDSVDLTTWTDERLPTVDDDTAGMVWAPDAIWDPSSEKYFVHWASRLFNESDTTHSGTGSNLKIRYALTSDFTTYSDPSTYIDNGDNDILDLAFLQVTDTDLMRFYRDGSVSGVGMEVTDSGIYGTWGKPAGLSVVASGYEGPYAWWSNTQDGLAYLDADLASGGTGLRAWSSSDPEAGAWTQNTTADMTWMRHGSVMPITQAQYDALSAM